MAVGSIPPPWAEVALSIYELHGTSALNLLTRAADMGGAYHVGVEVYFLEWSFGWCEEGSGVYMVFPGQSTLGTFRERVPLGRTPLTPQEVFRILDMMRQELLGSKYDLLRCNCAHFSVSFVKRLRVSEAPAWVNSLANVGEHLVAQLGMAGAQAAANAATPAERDRVAPSYVRFGDEEELEDMATDGDELALRELAWRNAQTYTLEKAAEAERDARCLDLAMELKWNSADQDMGTKILTVLDDLRLWQALAEACAAGFGLPYPHTQNRREAGWSLLGEEESEEEMEDDGTCGNLEVHKLLRGSSNRLLMLRLRLRGRALGSKGEAPSWRGANFREALRQAVAPKRGLSVRWPAGVPQAIANLEVVTAPDQALFGSRVETSCGPYSSKVLHSQPKKTAATSSYPARKETREVAPILRVGQELQQWQNQQMQLWQSQSAAAAAPVEMASAAVASARTTSSICRELRFMWLGDHDRRGLRPRDLRQLDGGVPSDKVEQSLLKLQRIQQLDRLRRQR